MAIQPNPIQIQVNPPFWNTKRAFILGCSLSSLTFYLTVLGHQQAAAPLQENSPTLTQAIHLIGSAALTNPLPTAAMIAITPFVTQIVKTIGKALRFCFYDHPMIGAIVGSSAITAATIIYGPKMTSLLEATPPI